ncbi:MAG: hypothetical protein M1839_005526 [Geoglossum umbratile]|nr:MAG: hypothetical protein M1839_005526 [Geoglossum umbratile]
MPFESKSQILREITGENTKVIKRFEVTLDTINFGHFVDEVELEEGVDIDDDNDDDESSVLIIS